MLGFMKSTGATTEDGSGRSHEPPDRENDMGIKVSRELYDQLEDRVQNPAVGHYYDAGGKWKWGDMTQAEVSAMIAEADEWHSNWLDREEA